MKQRNIVNTKQNQVTAEKNWNDLRTGEKEKRMWIATLFT